MTVRARATVHSIDKNQYHNGKTALVVDDDKSVRRVFTKGLQARGFMVDTAETGKEALDKIRDRAYDVALIDARLPDMNGLDLLNVMEANSPDMTKIVITGYPTTEGGIKALEEGADAYLVKPVRREELLRVIEENLEKRKPSQKRPFSIQRVLQEKQDSEETEKK